MKFENTKNLTEEYTREKVVVKELREEGISRVDQAILNTSNVIEQNIALLAASNRGLLSQNILSHLRNLVEYVAKKIYFNGADGDPNDHSSTTQAIKHIKADGKYRAIYSFHDLLQKSVSHYTMGEEISERLMLKYYEYLMRLKIFLRQHYSMEIIRNLSDFPLDTDPQLREYYEKIAERIIKPSKSIILTEGVDRYYIQKVKPFFVGEDIFYEITFTPANSKSNKFDRAIAFSKDEIPSYYATKMSLHSDDIVVLNRRMSIQVVDSWQVNIRPCEFENFSRIFGIRKNYSGTNEYYRVMEYLTFSKSNLCHLVCENDYQYNRIKQQICSDSRVRVTPIFDLLDKCRSLINDNRPGSNVIKYLLYSLNNKIIKGQTRFEECARLSDLNLDYGCIPFDQMPFNSSLRNHNPRLYDVIDSIGPDKHEHELLARRVRNNTETHNILFSPIEELNVFGEVDLLIDRYNSQLYYKHAHRRIEKFKDHLYIKGYADDSAFIIRQFKELARSGIKQYSDSVREWLNNDEYVIDDEQKKEAIIRMFANSRVALIYGSAGTGKSFLVNHVANFFSDKEKLFLANTNPAVDNLRRKVRASNSNFMTIAKFLSRKNLLTQYDLLVIDESSTVSNADMRKVLEKANFKILLLVGDIHQIESILFGNWFSLARRFVDDNAIYELTKPYRSTNKALLTVWERVREMDVATLEPIVKSDYSSRLDDSLFRRESTDEIILCLNYDGLYGINNINRFLQNSNPNPSFYWGINVYKVGDPILFNENERFSPVIYNNMKGWIHGIEKNDNKIYFEIELDTVLNELDVYGMDFELSDKLSDNHNSIIRFSVDKYRSTDEDNDTEDTIVPFQIAYAVSIHKAQGLEYKSVKIVITNEAEEKITHNIFYTAITRAREKLKIYWSPETEKKILENMSINDSIKDAELLQVMFEDL